MGFIDPFSDDYDLPPTLEVEEEPLYAQRQSEGQPADGLFNFATVLVLLATAGVIVYVALLTINPLLPINPFPPRPPLPTPTLIALPGAEPAQVGAQAAPPEASTAPPAESLPTATEVPTLSVPTSTRAPVEQGTPATPGEEPVVEATEAYAFVPQGDITYLEHTGSAGCRGTWIAGQVFGLDGDVQLGLPVLVTGEDFQEIQVTGAADLDRTGGFEFRVANSNVAAEFDVKIVNPTTGQDLSAPVTVTTRNTCEESLALVNFVQVLDYQQ